MTRSLYSILYIVMIVVTRWLKILIYDSDTFFFGGIHLCTVHMDFALHVV